MIIDPISVYIAQTVISNIIQIFRVEQELFFIFVARIDTHLWYIRRKQGFWYGAYPRYLLYTLVLWFIFYGSTAFVWCTARNGRQHIFDRCTRDHHDSVRSMLGSMNVINFHIIFLYIQDSYIFHLLDRITQVSTLLQPVFLHPPSQTSLCTRSSCVLREKVPKLLSYVPHGTHTQSRTLLVDVWTVCSHPYDYTSQDLYTPLSMPLRKMFWNVLFSPYKW